MYFLIHRLQLRSSRRGQSLMEVLLAISLGTVMILGGVAVIAPALKSNTDVSRTQVAVAFGKGLLDVVRVWAEADWHRVFTLAPGSANHYYMNATSSPFTVAAGEENVSIATTTYTRYFYLENIYRDASENVVASGGTLDPSTKQVTVVYGWQGGTTSTFITYLTRSRNKAFRQTDWSGGGGQAGPTTSTRSSFFSATANMDFTSIPGSISVKLGL